MPTSSLFRPAHLLIKCGVALSTLLFVAPTMAEQVATLTVTPSNLVAGQVFEIKMAVSVGTGRVDLACAVDVAFGDGKTQEVRVAPNLPATINHTYAKEGTYALVVVGKTMYRGLGTAWACDGEATSMVLKVAPVAAIAPAPAPAPISVTAPAVTPSAAPVAAPVPAPAPLPLPIAAPVVAPAAAVPAVPDADDETWQLAKRANSHVAYEAYLSGFPQGRYAAAARISLAVLGPKEPAPVSTSRKLEPPPAQVAKPLPPANKPAAAKPTATKPAAVDDAAQREWTVWQQNMKNDYDRVAGFNGSPDLQAKAWERFLAVWGTNNPFSTDDESLRQLAQQRLEQTLRTSSQAQ